MLANRRKIKQNYTKLYKIIQNYTKYTKLYKIIQNYTAPAGQKSRFLKIEELYKAHLNIS